MKTENLFRVFESIKPLSKAEKEQLTSILNEVSLAKDDYWIEENKTNNKIAFIQEGYLRKYYLKDGNEITDYFYFENSFCADLPSIIGNYLPVANVVAMTPTPLLTFAYDDFMKLCQQSHAFEHIYRVILEQTFLQFYRRTTSFILQTPKQRYEELLQKNPQLLQRATQYHIASYLGISYQHLSRLRSEK